MVNIQAQVSEQAEFKAMAHALCVAVRKTFQATRVSLAWDNDAHLAERSPQLLVSSGGSVKKIAGDLRRALTAAIDESILQQHSLSSLDSNETGRITAAHRALANQCESCVVTVPLAIDQQAIGAICIELPLALMPAGSVTTRQRLQNIMLFTERLLPPCTRLLKLAAQAEQPLWRAWWARRRNQTTDRQTRRRRYWWWAGIAIVTILLLIPFEQSITSQARLEGAIEREITAPIDGYIQTVGVKPGDSVAAGQILATLGRRELDLELTQLRAQLKQNTAQANAAMAAGDRATMGKARAEMTQVNARIDLLELQLEQTDVRAPLAGTILQGDLSERIDTPVDRGETLFKIAPNEKLRVIIEVDERDISYVYQSQAGELALSALPWERFALSVNRIAPIAIVRETRNIVEVRASLIVHPPGLKPGQRGAAHLQFKRQNLITRWAGRLLDSISRVWWRWRPW